MKKLIFAALTLISFSAFADKEFRYMPNQAGGYIYFTYESCVYPGTTTPLPGSFYFYTTNGGGAKTQGGCYTYSKPFYQATYSDGSQYIWNMNNTYPIGK